MPERTPEELEQTRLGDMTAAERRKVIEAACAKLKRELESAPVKARIIAILEDR